jgi:hypothetical protein
MSIVHATGREGSLVKQVKDVLPVPAGVNPWLVVVELTTRQIK